MRKTASNEKLLRWLRGASSDVGFSFLNFEEGIRKTVEWYQDNGENARK
jgi:hypothetical protein